MTPGWLVRDAGGDVDTDLLLDVAAEAFGVDVEELIGPSPASTITRFRHISMAAMREVTGLSFPRLGEVFGDRHHTTVMNGCRRVDREFTAARDRLVVAMRDALGDEP